MASFSDRTRLLVAQAPILPKREDDWQAVAGGLVTDRRPYHQKGSPKATDDSRPEASLRRPVAAITLAQGGPLA